MRIIFHPHPHRIRHQPGEMNATERAYAEYLQGLKYEGEIISCQFEAVTFTLAHNEPGLRNGCTYTPDFRVVVAATGDSIHWGGNCAGIEIQCHDVKALWTEKTKKGVKRAPKYEEDARVKIKVAAELFPEYRWFGVWRDESGVWNREEF
jgi:hypothetical protein